MSGVSTTYVWERLIWGVAWFDEWVSTLVCLARDTHPCGRIRIPHECDNRCVTLMATNPLDRVLSCPNLPSLPAAAMRVLELTRDPGTSIQTIAQTVQNDPALTTKVLKTVNSSYYGLSVPCPSITRAMSLLGLNTVKSIVLGFSLVDTSKAATGGTKFDMAEYWRRAMQTAVAARAIVAQLRIADPEEGFVGALVSDIGMLASVAALKNEYLELLGRAPEDHDVLAAFEKDTLGFDHPSVGKQIAEKWKLPQQIVACIGHHHNQDKCHPQHMRLVQAVALGGMIAACLKHPDSTQRLGAVVVHGKKWFGLEMPQCKDFIQQAAKGASELAKLLEVNIGAKPDLSVIMSEAHEQMLEAQEGMAAEAAELSRRTVTDALTGAFNRAFYDKELDQRYAEAVEKGQPLSVLFIDADKFKSVNDTHGHQAGDAVLKELSSRLRDAVGAVASVCRYGGEEFGVIVPGANAERAMKLGELVRRCICMNTFDLTRYSVGIASLPITISVGVGSFVPGGKDAPKTPAELTHLADEAVYAAKQAGRNCVKVGGTEETSQRVASGGASILIVEDDPLAAKLLEVLFGRRRDIRTCVAKSAAEALKFYTDPARAATLPDVIITDVNMPEMSGIDMVRVLRQTKAGQSVPVIVVSAATDAKTRADVMTSGANAFVDKNELTISAETWLDKIVAMVGESRSRKAA